MSHPKDGERGHAIERFLWPLTLLAVVILGFGVPSAQPTLRVADVLRGLGNPEGRDLANLPVLFSHAYYATFWESAYHPLPTLLYWFNDGLCGLDPTCSRIFQVLLLWMLGMLVEAAGREDLGRWAWLAAFLYVLHPMHFFGMITMRHQLVALFCLAGLLAHRRSAAAGHPARMIMAVGLIYILAMSSKEHGVVLPLLLFAEDVAAGRIPTSSSGRQRWRYYYGFLGALTIAYGLLLLRIGPGHGGQQFSLSYSSSESVRALLDRLMQFGLLLVYPIGQWSSAFGICALLLLTGLLLWGSLGGEKKPAKKYFLWFLIGILPLSGLLPVAALSDWLAHHSDVPLHHLILGGVGMAWLLALALRSAVSTRRWLLYVIVAGLTARTISPLFLQRTIEEHSLAGLRNAAHERDTNDMVEILSILISLPYMRGHVPEAYRKYHVMMESSFGERTPTIESYFQEAFTSPCRRSSIYAQKEDRSFDQLWRDIQNDLVFSDGCRELRSGHSRTASERFRGILRRTPNSHWVLAELRDSGLEGSAGLQNALHETEGKQDFRDRWCRCSLPDPIFSAH